MRRNGEKLNAPKPIEVPILRSGEEPLIFKCGTVLDYEEFFKVNPRPTPPTVRKPGKKPVPDFTDEAYDKASTEWAESKTMWMFLKSLAATEWLEWDTVDMNDPSTWKNYEKEMNEAGMTEIDIARVQGGILEANGLNQLKIDEAFDALLAGTQVPAVSD
jgi:hypothetical protein